MRRMRAAAAAGAGAASSSAAAASPSPTQSKKRSGVVGGIGLGAGIITRRRHPRRPGGRYYTPESTTAPRRPKPSDKFDVGRDDDGGSFDDGGSDDDAGDGGGGGAFDPFERDRGEYDYYNRVHGNFYDGVTTGGGNRRHNDDTVSFGVGGERNKDQDKRVVRGLGAGGRRVDDGGSGGGARRGHRDDDDGYDSTNSGHDNRSRGGSDRRRYERGDDVSASGSVSSNEFDLDRGRRVVFSDGRGQGGRGGVGSGGGGGGARRPGVGITKVFRVTGPTATTTTTAANARGVSSGAQAKTTKTEMTTRATPSPSPSPSDFFDDSFLSQPATAAAVVSPEPEPAEAFDPFRHDDDYDHDGGGDHDHHHHHRLGRVQEDERGRRQARGDYEDDLEDDVIMFETDENLDDEGVQGGGYEHEPSSFDETTSFEDEPFNDLTLSTINRSNNSGSGSGSAAEHEHGEHGHGHGGWIDVAAIISPDDPIRQRQRQPQQQRRTIGGDGPGPGRRPHHPHQPRDLTASPPSIPRTNVSMEQLSDPGVSMPPPFDLDLDADDDPDDVDVVGGGGIDVDGGEGGGGHEMGRSMLPERRQTTRQQQPQDSLDRIVMELEGDGDGDGGNYYNDNSNDDHPMPGGGINNVVMMMDSSGGTGDSSAAGPPPVRQLFGGGVAAGGQVQPTEDFDQGSGTAVVGVDDDEREGGGVVAAAGEGDHDAADGDHGEEPDGGVTVSVSLHEEVSYTTTCRQRGPEEVDPDADGAVSAAAARPRGPVDPPRSEEEEEEAAATATTSECRVHGVVRIHLSPTMTPQSAAATGGGGIRPRRGDPPPPPPFYLQLVDPRRSLTVKDVQDEFAEDVTSIFADDDDDHGGGGEEDGGERTIQIDMPPHLMGKLLDVVFYETVETDVKVAGRRFCRVVIKISPNDDFFLGATMEEGERGEEDSPSVRTVSQMSIIMAVPRSVDASTVKMSRRGGRWDDLGRTLSWHVDRVKPGRDVVIQSQFEFARAGGGVDEGEEEEERSGEGDDEDGATADGDEQRGGESTAGRWPGVGGGEDDVDGSAVAATPSFPTMVRCTVDGRVGSALDVNVCEEEGHGVNMTQSISKSLRLLHRVVGSN